MEESLLSHEKYVDDRSAGLEPLIVTLNAVFSLLIFQRFAFKFYNKLGPDDSKTIVMFILNIPVDITFGLLMANSLGRDIWNVSFSHIVSFFLQGLICNWAPLFCSNHTPQARSSFLLPPHLPVHLYPPPSIEHGGLQCLKAASYLSSLLLFHANPLLTSGMHEAANMKVAVPVWRASYGPVLHSAYRLTYGCYLPLSQIMALNLSWKRKIQVGLMFSAGMLWVSCHLLFIWL